MQPEGKEEQTHMKNSYCIPLLHCYFNVMYARRGPVADIHLSLEEDSQTSLKKTKRTLQQLGNVRLVHI